MRFCRICRSKDLIQVLNYRKNAFAGSLLKKRQLYYEKKHNLKLNLCNNCKHVQINDLIDPSKLFKNYLWETGISKSNIELINELVKDIKNNSYSKKYNKVFEIASNDGTCLSIIKNKLKSNIIGIDPAKNIALDANRKNIFTLNKFFSYKYSKVIKNKFGKFDVCLSRNMIAHVHDPVDIFNGVKNILNDDGIFIVEFPHLLNIFKEIQYDNVFHEHIGYHSLKSILDIAKICKLTVFNVKKVRSQGGSLRVFVSKNNKLKLSKDIFKIINEEKKVGLFRNSSWIKFKKRVDNNLDQLNKLFLYLKLQNNKISVYGASGKGQTLLQLLNNSNNIFDKIYDKSNLKQGLYTPGTHIKIENPKKIYKDMPDYIFVCTWNIIEEILVEHNKYRKIGGKFIIPFPNPKII